MKKRTAYLMLCIFFTSLTAFAQVKEKTNTPAEASETHVNIQRSIRIEKDSKTEEIIIDVKPKTQKMALMINSSVTEGKLTIEVYDPNEIKQGNFTVGTQLSSDKKEYVSGNIMKNMNEPQAGKWTVKIIPTNATGTVNLKNDVLE